MRRLTQAKGFDEEARAFLDACRSGGSMPIPLGESVAVTRATFAAMRSLRTGRPEPVRSIEDC